MKILTVLLLPPLAAQANTLTALQRPLPPPARYVCAATGFSGDGLTVTGKCQQSIPTNVKYQQPARYIFDVTWNLAGALTSSALACYSPAHMGADHSGCPQMVTYSDTNTVVVIHGVPFWYVSTNLNGAEAVNNQTDAYLWQP
jgi:hypothetical protein